MKPACAQSVMHIVYGSEHNVKDPTFKVGDHVRISKKKSFLAKTTHQISLRKPL